MYIVVHKSFKTLYTDINTNKEGEMSFEQIKKPNTEPNTQINTNQTQTKHKLDTITDKELSFET